MMVRDPRRNRPCRSPGSTTLVVTVRSLKLKNCFFPCFVQLTAVTGTAESKITDWRGATEKEVGRK